MKRWLICLGVVMGCLAPVAPTRSAEDSVPLKIISYNIQFLPGPAQLVNKRGNNEYRAKTIGERLTEFDIVGLNEAFEERHRSLVLEQFQKAWGKDYHAVVGPEPKESWRYNGGLAILTKLPILESHDMIYKNISLPKDYGAGADGFASKGVLHARVGWGDSKEVFLDVFVTHMEARDDSIRELQYVEMGNFIREHAAPNAPMLVLGDMNTRGNPEYMTNPEAPYHRLLKNLGSSRPMGSFLDLWPHLEKGPGGTSKQSKTDGGSRIDYVFFSNPMEGASALVPLKIEVDPYFDPKVVALSDHSAVKADFNWKRKK
ncbi:MAG: sphingomyelin phosphodiesterase [Planctomycetota bacterium]